MKTTPYSARPRTIKNRQPFLEPLQLENKPKDDQHQNNKSIDKFLNTELSYANNDSDKLFAYQKAFDMLLNEFQICRPLLSRIKKQYDMISNELISKKRELSLNAASTSSSEDILSDSIDELRKVRTHEFAQKKNESESLLDQMTQLRIKRSELLQQLSNLTEKDNDLSNSDNFSTDKIIEMNTKIIEISDFIKSTESASRLKRKQIDELHDEISKTQQSKDELAEKDQFFQSQNLLLEKEENELQLNIKKMDHENTELSKEISDLQNKTETLNKKKKDANIKLKFVEIGHKSNEDKLRNLLKETDIDIDPDLPIEELLSKIKELQ